MRSLRLKRGWSQGVLADRSGLNRAHVGEIERGESNVTIQTLKIIADRLALRSRILLTDPVAGRGNNVEADTVTRFVRPCLRHGDDFFVTACYGHISARRRTIEAAPLRITRTT